MYCHHLFVYADTRTLYADTRTLYADTRTLYAVKTKDGPIPILISVSEPILMVSASIGIEIIRSSILLSFYIKRTD